MFTSFCGTQIKLANLYFNGWCKISENLWKLKIKKDKQNTHEFTHLHLTRFSQMEGHKWLKKDSRNFCLWGKNDTISYLLWIKWGTTVVSYNLTRRAKSKRTISHYSKLSKFECQLPLRQVAFHFLIRQERAKTLYRKCTGFGFMDLPSSTCYDGYPYQ